MLAFDHPVYEHLALASPRLCSQAIAVASGRGQGPSKLRFLVLPLFSSLSPGEKGANTHD